MQQNSLSIDHRHWLNKRGISDQVLELFSITSLQHELHGEVIRIPYSDTHAKYRRDPQSSQLPKYMYDVGGKVTLFAADKITDYSTVVITEGEFDALVLWSMNIQAVSSTGGALSFQAEWVEFFSKFQNVYVCFDVDDAGADGMVKLLKYVPQAKVILLPDIPNVKDVSDFVGRGGDFMPLMESAKCFDVLTAEEDMRLRKANWQSTRFHERFLAESRKVYERANRKPVDRSQISDEVLRAKAYPMDQLIDFKQRKACCLWHNEKTPSLHYYPKTNTAYCFGGCGKAYDAISAYQAKYGVGFKEAVKALNNIV